MQCVSFLLFICCLFNDALKNSRFPSSSGLMFGEKRIANNAERSDLGIHLGTYFPGMRKSMKEVRRAGVKNGI